MALYHTLSGKGAPTSFWRNTKTRLLSDFCHRRDFCSILVISPSISPSFCDSQPMSPFFDFHHTVTADEIDAQQHVHNLRYLQWTLWAAGGHTKASGWDTPGALAKGLGWVVRGHEIKYRAAAVAGDEVIVRTWVSEVQRFASRRKYVICRPADQTVLARVETRWVFVDLYNHRALAIPDAARKLLVIPGAPPPLPWESNRTISSQAPSAGSSQSPTAEPPNPATPDSPSQGDSHA